MMLDFIFGAWLIKLSWQIIKVAFELDTNFIPFSSNVEQKVKSDFFASVIEGSCILGDNVHIAMSATIREKIKIGKNSIVGMGSVVIKDVPSNVTVFGIPAKIS